MRQVCAPCAACEDRTQDSRPGDLDLVQVTLDDHSLRSPALPAILKTSRNGREVTLGPGHFGLEHCCTAQATLTMPTVPEIWEVINEENWTSATSSPKAPKQLEMTDPVPATGEVEWGVEEYADPTLSMTPHKKKGCCLPGHRMDDQEMLEHLWWVLWCCCMGFGVSRQSAPLGVTFNCLCANSSCQTTPLRDQQGNCCGTFTELCCCSCICRGPPMPGDPRCVCCTVDLCGLVGSTAREGPTEGKKLGRLAAIDESFSQACIPCWCCCCGSRLAMPNNCIDTYIKLLWCEYFFHTGIPSVEAGLCLHMVNCWCCYSLCKCPPTVRHNPLCACCGRQRIEKS